VHAVLGLSEDGFNLGNKGLKRFGGRCKTSWVVVMVTGDFGQLRCGCWAVSLD